MNENDNKMQEDSQLISGVKELADFLIKLPTNVTPWDYYYDCDNDYYGDECLHLAEKIIGVGYGRVEDYKKEIERLQSVEAELQELNARYYNEAKDSRREIKELKEEIENLENRIKRLQAVIVMAEQEYNVELPFMNEFDYAIKEAKENAIKEFMEIKNGGKTNYMTKVYVVKNGSIMDQDIVGVFSSKEEAVKYIKKHYPSPWNIEPDDGRSSWTFQEVCFNCIDDKNNYIIK